MMAIKEATCDEHWIVYESDEINITLYINQLELKLNKTLKK